MSTLCDYTTGNPIRPATPEEQAASLGASRYDGGMGVILVEGAPCYVEATLTEAARDRAHSVLCTAIEGGITYWAEVLTYRWMDPERDYRPDTHATVRDAEDEEAEVHTLNAQSIIWGLSRLASGEVGAGSPSAEESWSDALRKVLAGDDEVDLDASDADCIVQAALFGEIVYG